ncbi:hypothetical protein TrST_g11490 [Triparma strigata]|uniref:Uncharacterized protein n=1 Tax=Triparma strigata TaxID=1606541 RepID=A0A9W7DY60_9STRA|nr:hypothetical protein TrST_g11490 [Triparma strigata]
MTNAPHRQPAFLNMPRSVVSGVGTDGAESSYNLSRRANSWSDSEVSELTEPNFTRPPVVDPNAFPAPGPGISSQIQPRNHQTKVNLTASSANFILFPSRHLPLDQGALAEALARLPTRDYIAQEQGFLIQVNDRGRSGYEVKTSMAIDDVNTSSSTVNRNLTDFELLQEQLQVENPGALIPTLGNRLDRSSDDAQTLEVWLFDILTGCRREGYYVTESVDIGKSHAIEAFLFDSRNLFSSTVNEINLDLKRKSAGKSARAASASTAGGLLTSDILKTLGSVGCFSPSLDAPVSQSVQRSGLAVALFGCSSHQAPLRGPSPELLSSFSWDRHDENQTYLAAFYEQKQHMAEVLGVVDARIPMEEARGANWKLLAVTLTALANMERQWENATFLSVDASTIAHEKQVKQNNSVFATSENSLYLLARQKVEKFSSLSPLRDLLRGFHDDLLMIGPASVSYENARKTMEKCKEPPKAKGWSVTLSPRQNKISEDHHQAKISYARTGSTLNGGLRELATHNSITYGRISYIYYKGLAKSSSRMTITSTEVSKKLKQVKRNMRTTPAHYPYAGDDAKEIKVVKELLAFSSGGIRATTHMHEILEASYTKRFSNRNTGFLLEIATGGDIFDTQQTQEWFSESGDLEVGGTHKTGMKEMLENEKFVRQLRETALQCVESISALTKEIVLDGVPFDVSKTRVHFSRTLVAMLAAEETHCKAPNGTSWVDNDKVRCCGSVVEEVLLERIQNEKELLRDILAALTSFLAFLEGINSFVNLEKLAFRVENDCARQRHNAMEKLEEKANIQLQIQTQTKKRNKEAVYELKVRVRELEEFTPSLLKLMKEKHKASKILKEKLLKLSKRRLKVLRTHSHIKLIDIVEIWAEVDLKQSRRETDSLDRVVEIIKERHTVVKQG